VTRGVDPPLDRRKIRDQALILPLVGLILLTPPVAGIFELDVRIAGVPFTLLYLFTVWAMLIAGALWLSRRLRDGANGSAVAEAVEPEAPGSKAGDGAG
jgi:hypothetical protein